MFDKKSDYALNKLDRDAIVYKSASGVHIRLTRADFASEGEFLRWKDWSDDSYCEIEKADASYSKHTCSSSEWSGSTQSPEAAIIEAQNQKEQQELCRLLQDGLDTCLTPFLAAPSCRAAECGPIKRLHRLMKNSYYSY